MFDYDEEVEISNDIIKMEVPIEANEGNEKRVALELQVSYDSVTLYNDVETKKTILTVVSGSEVCEGLRNNGDFFLSVADALNIDRELIIELD